MIRFLAPWLLLWLLIPLGYLALRRSELRGKTLTDRLAIWLRVGAIALLVLAWAGPQMKSRAENHYVYFLVDISQSTRAALSPDFLERLNRWASPQPRTQYGVIVFAEQPFVEAPFAPSLNLEELHTTLGGEATDLAAAIELALATFPQDGTKTIVLLSDGQPTQGALATATRRAAREGVPIFTMAMEAPATEFSIQDVRVPREVALGLPFAFQSVIYASRPSLARLLVYRDETLIASQELTLQAGLNFFEQRDELEQPGLHEYRAELIAPDDAILQNNVYRALVEAVGGPRILLVEADLKGPSPLERMLSSAGHVYARVSLRAFAPTPTSLLSYRAVILDDVPLKELSRSQIANLTHYVQDLGGGLWLIQGRRAVEEFYDRQLERLLPVTYEGPEELQRPALALVMLLDKSGSMGEIAGTQPKIELLKQAAIAAVDKLDARNLLGLIAFDSTYQWLVPLEPVRSRKGDIRRKIEGLSANGGTDVYNALRDAVASLQKVRARVKHILVFSDGKVAREGRDFERIFREIAQSTITASAIAIGAQADIEFLWRLAEVGQGIKYEVKDAKDLPQITLEEVIRLERARWIKGPVPVVPGPYAFELRQVDPRAIPPVDGYVLTFEKPMAQTLLQIRAEDAQADPLVSHWRYGLGKVLVLNTSFSDEGLGRWLSWEGLGTLAAELLSRVYSDAPLAPKELTLQTELEGSLLRVTAEAARDGRWLDLLSLEGRLSAPDSEPQALTFEQVAPGRYQASVPDLTEGVYLLSVGEESLGWVQEAISIPYAAEYRRIGVNQELLTRLSYETRGEYLENLEGLAPLLRGRAWFWRDIWQTLALLALALFLVDLIFRKLPTPGS